MGRVKLFSVSIKDCELQTFRSGGKGGQNQDKRETGVRILHRPSGAVGESREHRTQWQNKKTAWQRMSETYEFRYWVSLMTGKIETEKEYLSRQMDPRNIKTEVRDENGRWAEEK